MDFYNFLIPLLGGLIICVFIVTIKFVDLVGLLLRIVPFKNISGYDLQKNFQNSQLYQHHKKKWKLVYLLLPLSYMIFYILFAVVIQSIMISFLLALILSSIVFGIIENIESKERKYIIKEWKKRQSGDGSAIEKRTQGDGSSVFDE